LQARWDARSPMARAATAAKESAKVLLALDPAYSTWFLHSISKLRISISKHEPRRKGESKPFGRGLKNTLGAQPKRGN
jgi:hypothetical protein